MPTTTDTPPAPTTAAERIAHRLEKFRAAFGYTERFPLVNADDLRLLLAEHAARGAALEALDLLLDFDSPVSDGLPVVFADTSAINAAFVQARAVLAST